MVMRPGRRNLGLGMKSGLRTSLLGVLSWVVAAGCDPGAEDARDADAMPGAPTGIRYLSGGDADGFARVLAPRAFRFPDDHGPHPGFLTEWWYFTGNLDTENRRHFGFELTFFRLGLATEGYSRESDWQGDSVWMAHFAITDTAANTFVANERLARSHRSLAFARAAPFEVRVEDWSVERTDDGSWQLRAAMPGYALALSLNGLDRIVGQGDAGYDRKGPEVGNASYYYSAPRLTAEGTLTTDEAEAVVGTAWLDREWSTSSLSPGIEGWDWFALQLSDGRDLMFYRLRDRNGGVSPFSGGSLTGAGGSAQRLDATAVSATPLRSWRSDSSGVEYPVAWRLEIPSEGIELLVEPFIDAQEIDLSVRYWEGAVSASGTARDRAISGRGYLELAGYE